MNYAQVLTEAYRRRLDEIEAGERGPISVTEYRNRQNVRAWSAPGARGSSRQR